MYASLPMVVGGHVLVLMVAVLLHSAVALVLHLHAKAVLAAVQDVIPVVVTLQQ